ncbi:MAG: sulfatase-like hydrolase/transferase [Muribaculaceae bacterium]|nr:sulfatase-like hydrolase/transferase [Muribaculaceae bacterium]
MIWYVIVFVGLLMEWGLMKNGLDIKYSSNIGTLMKAFGDVVLILLPYWLLAPKWRWTALLPIWFFAVCGVINLVYYRFWSDLIPPAAVTMGGNVDGNLMEYGLALFRDKDLLMICIPCLASAAILFVKPSDAHSFSTRMKCILTIVSIMAGAAGQASYFKTTYSWQNAITPLSFRERLEDHFTGGYTGQRQLYTYNGPVYYSLRFVYDAICLLIDTLDLTEQQREEIAEFLKIYERKDYGDDHEELTAGGTCNLDSINVVYIIVESLNSDMVGRRIGEKAVMPTLDSLAVKEGTTVFDNVVSQIKASSSSDGHLLLMTGLLPPEKAAYSIMYGSNNKFPSLADALPKHNKYLLLADEGVCWNEGNTLRNFGLGEPLAIKDRPQYPTDKYGRDGAMFMQATEMMKEIKEPFFMTLMTISMHIPFREKAWSLPADLMSAEGLTQMEKDYANMCRNTDRWIGTFLKSLPENTIVFIASDHHQEIASDEAGDTRAFFMAVNSGRTERISRTVGQVNLFPATLDILGIYKGYGGVARSAFDGSVDGTVDSYGNVYGKPSQGALDTLGRAYELSDMIIRGDYFRAIGQ